MKKITITLILLTLTLSCITVFASGSALLPVVGISGEGVAENFSSAEFENKVFKERDLSITVPGWGFITEGSVIDSVNSTDFGEKSFEIPLGTGDVKTDIGMRVSSKGNASKRAYIDVWNIPLENIGGAENYRIEYNVYVSYADTADKSGIISDISFYATDVPGATKNVGIIGFQRDGTVVAITDITKTKYKAIKGSDGQNITYKNNSWQHVSLDINSKTGKYTFALNGTEILKNEPLSFPVELNAAEGTYRLRLAFTPIENDSESFVVFDDVLFAKEVSENTIPAFAGFSDGYQDKNGFFGGTKGIAFSGVVNA